MKHDLTDILRACRELFGSEVEVSPEFVAYLQPEGVKAAYRSRAKQTHPDSATGGDSADFIRTRDAYLLLTEYFRLRNANEAVTFAASGQKPWQRRHMYHGSVPARRHPLGRYLYYRGVISYQSLLAAISWQRSTNLTMGAVACSWGWLSTADVRRILACSAGRRFGETAIRLGLLSPLQVNTLLLHQQSARRKIGQYFIQQQILEPAELHELLREFRLHNLQNP